MPRCAISHSRACFRAADNFARTFGAFGGAPCTAYQLLDPNRRVSYRTPEGPGKVGGVALSGLAFVGLPPVLRFPFAAL